eukprot:11155695-Lingulodinium_polyedra.AAC.1
MRDCGVGWGSERQPGFGRGLFEVWSKVVLRRERGSLPFVGSFSTPPRRCPRQSSALAGVCPQTAPRVCPPAVP